MATSQKSGRKAPARAETPAGPVRTYVLDTSVLLSDPGAIRRFAGTMVPS